MGNTLIDLAIGRFDLFAFLDDNGIDYSMHGKNIGIGFVGIYECPHCSIGNYHYGININDKYGTCWSCGQSDNLINIIKNLLNINYHEAKDYLLSSTFTEDDIEIQVNSIFNPEKTKEKSKKEKSLKELKTVELYKYIGKNKTITEFCNNKKITTSLAKEQNLQISIGTRFKNSLIIPVYYKFKMVGYQARSFTNRFFHNEGPLKHHLYNYDNIKKGATIFIIEGFTDWASTIKFLRRFRRNTNYQPTTPFSKILTDEQIVLLEEIEPKKVVFMLDYDAWFQYYKPSYKLFCDTDFIIVDKDKDPGQLSTSQFLKVFIGHGL